MIFDLSRHGERGDIMGVGELFSNHPMRHASSMIDDHEVEDRRTHV